MYCVRESVIVGMGDGGEGGSSGGGAEGASRTRSLEACWGLGRFEGRCACQWRAMWYMRRTVQLDRAGSRVHGVQELTVISPPQLMSTKNSRESFLVLLQSSMTWTLMCVSYL